MTLPNTGKIIHAFDSAGRLTSTQLQHSNHPVLDKHDYVYNTRHERTKQPRADGSYVNFTYDNLGQLQSALGYTAGGTPLTAEQKGYTYDAGWNLTVRTNNGFTTTFGVDARNQLTTLDRGAAPAATKERRMKTWTGLTRFVGLDEEGDHHDCGRRDHSRPIGGRVPEENGRLPGPGVCRGQAAS